MVESELLAAVLASPDDDWPRLEYSDWLSARDDPRGEFIRAQCALARPMADGAARRQLIARAARLYLANAGAWSAALGLCVGEGAFVRGFVERATLAWPRLREVHAALCDRTPLRGVRVRPLDTTNVAALLALSVLDRLAALDLSCNQLGQGAASALARVRRLGRITALNLASNEIGAAGAHALAGAPCLGGLRMLSLRGNALGAAGAGALASSRHLVGLTTLDLSRNQLGTAGARTLADAPWLDRLASLDVSGNGLDADAIAALRVRFRGSLRA